jgi:hypothetical protein
VVEARSGPPQIEVLAPASVFIAERQVKCSGSVIVECWFNSGSLLFCGDSLKVKRDDLRMNPLLKRVDVQNGRYNRTREDGYFSWVYPISINSLIRNPVLWNLNVRSRESFIHLLRHLRLETQCSARRAIVGCGGMRGQDP